MQRAHEPPAFLIRRPHRLRPWALTAVLAGAVGIAPHLSVGVAAQTFDDPLVPRGTLRFDVSAGFIAFEERFGLRSEGGRTVEELEPLGFDWSTASLGSALLPGAFPEEDLLRSLLGDPGYDVDLGATRLGLEARITRIPVRMGLGLTDWLTVAATVPFVRRRYDAGFEFDGRNANVGAAPGAISFLSNYQVALVGTSAAVSQLCQGAGSTAPECTGAQAFLAEATSLFQSLDELYGVSRVFPLEGSAGGDALNERVDAVRAGMADLGVAGFAAPLPLASDPLGREAFVSEFVTPLYGSVGLPGEGWLGPWELGDVEVGLALRLLDTTGREPDADSAEAEGAGPGIGVRLGGSAFYRLATGTPDTLRDFVEVETVEGASAIRGHVFADLVLGSRFLVHLDGVYETFGSADVVRRIAPSELPYDPSFGRALVRWTPGSRTTFLAIPRLLLAPGMALGLRYGYTSRQADGFELASPPGEVTVDPAVLAVETESSVQEVGIEVILNTIRPAVRGRSRLPMEVRVGYDRAVSGSGGRAPRTGVFRVGLGLYRTLWGGG